MGITSNGLTRLCCFQHYFFNTLLGAVPSFPLLRAKFLRLPSVASSRLSSKGFSLPPVLAPRARFSLASLGSRDGKNLGQPLGASLE